MYLKRLLGMGAICFGLFAASTCFEKNVYAEEFEINEVNIPDESLRESLAIYDLNKDGKISDEENSEATEVSVRAKDNLKGLELFKNINGLRILYSSNDVTVPEIPGVKEIRVNFDCKDAKLKFDKNDSVEEIICNCSYYGYFNSVDISNLVNIKQLAIHNTEIESLDLSNNLKLEKIWVSGNALKELIIPEGMPLNELDCSGNKLTKLEIAKETPLVVLDCSYNNLTQVDFSGLDMLESLNIEDNKVDFNNIKFNKDSIKNLKVNFLKNKNYVVKNFKNLESLNVYTKKSKKITISNCKKLKNLSVGFNKLNSFAVKKCNSLKDVDLTGSIKNINISGKKVKSIILAYNKSKLKKFKLNTPKLEELFVERNKITSLDVSKFKNLKYLDCSYNKLTKLDVSKNKKLQTLKCQFNKLSTIDVRNCKKLKELYAYGNNIKKIDVTNNKKIKIANNYVGGDIDLYQSDVITVKHTKIVKENGRRYLVFADLKKYKKLKKMVDEDND